MSNAQFQCDIAYSPSMHLAQVYAGFQALQKQGIVNLRYLSATSAHNKPVIKATINGRDVIYDTLDGLNWIKGTVQENLQHFKNNISADFYFKRSFNSQVAHHAPANCKVFPLGFNYQLRDELNFRKGIKLLMKDIFFGKRGLPASDFEALPVPGNKFKILFLTRLWDPSEVEMEHVKEDRERINSIRISAVKACKKEFPQYFTGGLLKDDFSLKHAGDLVVPADITGKRNFLQQVKDHPVCIATAGLHGSLGWKFGEYVAASRAIITEPMDYEVTGDFTSSKNYLEFTNEDELLNNIYYLLKNPGALQEMMTANWKYYHEYLKPEKLIFNTLIKIGAN